MTGTSLPIVLPYAGTVAVETPDISGQRAIVHFILFLLCLYFGFFSKPKDFSVRHLGALQKLYASAPPWMIATNVRFGS